jgi:hypothetical protein
MRVRGRPHRRRSVVRVVSAVTVGALVVSLGAAPETGTPRGTARPASGFPAGEAVEVAGAPPWWRSMSPAAVGVDVPNVGVGTMPTSDTVTTFVPGSATRGTGSELVASTATPGLGSQSIPEVLDAEPVHGPDWVQRTEEGFEVSRGRPGTATGRSSPTPWSASRVVGVDLLALTAAVEEALHDPRSWSRDHTLRRVEDPAAADIRVLLATPSTVDRLCAETGLDTEGRYSCWNGTFAALNARRWRRGARTSTSSRPTGATSSTTSSGTGSATATSSAQRPVPWRR